MSELIAERGPGIKLPTLKEMCAQFELSRTPLEGAIRSFEGRGLLRRRHGSGIYVTDRVRQKVIGIVFGGNIFDPAQYSPFWHLLLQAVREQAGPRFLMPRTYLDVSVGHDGLGGQAQLAEDLEARRLDGLLLFSPDHERDEAGQLRSAGVPLVVFGGGETDWRVRHNPEALFRLGARELAARGCRRIALLGYDLADRRPLLQAELRAAGADAELFDWTFETWAAALSVRSTRERRGCELVRRILAEPAAAPPPDGLLSADDTVTRGALAALLEAGLRPGRDIRVVTSANKGSPVLEPYADDLIRIEYNPSESVRAALDMLGTLMGGGLPPAKRVLIDPRVVAGSEAEG